MPRSITVPLYHFDVSYDRGPWCEDTEGVNFGSIDEARREAIGLVADLGPDNFQSVREIAVRIRNGVPEPLVIVRAAMTIEGRA
jgi:hypothetical protein